MWWLHVEQIAVFSLRLYVFSKRNKQIQKKNNNQNKSPGSTRSLQDNGIKHTHTQDGERERQRERKQLQPKYTRNVDVMQLNESAECKKTSQK